MSFKRSDLVALGIESDKIQTLIDWHMETVKGLQSEIDKYKDNSDELAKVQAELDEVKKNLVSTNEKLTSAEKDRDSYKKKSEDSSTELDKLKNDYAAKELTAKRDSVIKKAAKERKFSDEAISILLDSKADYSGRVEFDKDGNASNLEDIFKAIAADKPMLIPKTETGTTTIATPPANTGGKKTITKDDIMGIKNTADRQAAIAANPELFGLPTN